MAAHVAAGTWVPRQSVSVDIVELVAREARIKRGRESLLDSSEYTDVRTSVRNPSADSHQFAPPQQATEPRRVHRMYLANRKRRVSLARLTAIAALRALGLRVGATRQEIRTAFCRSALVLHPDRGGSPQAFARLNQQYRAALTAL